MQGLALLGVNLMDESQNQPLTAEESLAVGLVELMLADAFVPTRSS